MGIDTDEVRSALPAPLFTAWLSQTDGSGAARPRYRWAPGLEEPLPVPGRAPLGGVGRFVVGGGPAAQRARRCRRTRSILERSLDGIAPTKPEVESLFRARSDQVDAIAWTADQLRRRTDGETVTYVINRNINYTNQCYFRCGFCAFSKGPRALNLRGEPYLMRVEGIVRGLRRPGTAGRPR